MLSVTHIQAAYGNSRVLFDVSLDLSQGQVVSVLKVIFWLQDLLLQVMSEILQ